MLSLDELQAGSIDLLRIVVRLIPNSREIYTALVSVCYTLVALRCRPRLRAGRIIQCVVPVPERCTATVTGLRRPLESSLLSISAMASHASLRNIFARETISQKSHILKSERDATDLLASNLAAEADGEDVFQSLQRHIDAVSSAPLAHGDSLKTAAKEAQVFLDLTRGSLGASSRGSPHADIAQNWLNRLTAEVKHLHRRAEHASLFGQVLQEWINSDGSSSSNEDSLGGAKRLAVLWDGDEGTMVDLLAPEPLSPFDVEA